MIARIIAIAFIFTCTTIAWFVLSNTVDVRTQTSNNTLGSEVGKLWGSELYQQAPTVSQITHQRIETEVNGKKKLDSLPIETAVHLDASDIDVKLKLDHRQKGLLWYSTYRVAFRGRYRIANPSNEPRQFNFVFSLPSADAVYDNFRIAVGQQEIETVDIMSGKIEQPLTIAAGSSSEITVSFESNGMDDWWYTFGNNVNQLRNFSLVVHTDFDAVDFPEKSISPTSKQRMAKGWDLRWQYRSLLSGVRIGVSMPDKLNPGPWVSLVTMFAPISLFLFFFFLFIFTTIKKIQLHPMHYFFISAAFFSFHLLLAYLVDHVSIHAAFAVASVASIALVVSYMRIVVGQRFAFLEVGISQFVYLVLFSYTFFFRGYTGLTLTIACVVTLFIVMQATARINWEEVFARDKRTQTPRFTGAVRHKTEQYEARGGGEKQEGPTTGGE